MVARTRHGHPSAARPTDLGIRPKTQSTRCAPSLCEAFDPTAATRYSTVRYYTNEYNEVTRLDAVLAAVADPTRRAILDRLAAGPARVTDLAEPFSMTFAGVSKHVRVLESAGLVKRQRKGREH